MSYLNEEQRIKNIIKSYKNKFPRAVALKKDNNLMGKFLEDLTYHAFTQNGLKVVNWAVLDGDRGIDLTIMVGSNGKEILLAVECMNGKFDYTPKYLNYLKQRLGEAFSKRQNPIIICVNKKVNFSRQKANFPFDVEYIELGKQFHPNTTTYRDYEKLKKQVWNTVNKIAVSERPEEMAEYIEEEEENKELDAIYEKKASKIKLKQSGNQNPISWK